MEQYRKIPLAISSGNDFVKKSNSSKLVNLFPHIEPAGSKSKFVLVNTPGTKKIHEFDSDILGVFTTLNDLYVLTKTAFYKKINDVYACIVSGLNLTQKARFETNGFEIIIISDSVYSFGINSKDLVNITQIPEFHETDSVGFIDGYFAFNRKGTGQFFISNLYDGRKYDALNFATAESYPDNLVCVASTARELWLLGEKSIEVWFNAGGEFPFQRIEGSINTIGCRTKDSVQRIDNSLFFISDDLKVYMTQGYQLIPISSSVVEKKLHEYKDIEIISFVFNEYGHYFYGFTIKNRVTYIYDITTGLWFNMETTGDAFLNIDGVEGNLAFKGKNLYEFSIDYGSYDGAPIKREIITLPLDTGNVRVRISEIEIIIDQIYNNIPFKLQISSDGGYNWGAENIAYSGKTGDTQARIRWRRLGQYRNVVTKISTISSDTIRIADMYAKVNI